jgi:hypothetical protein
MGKRKKRLTGVPLGSDGVECSQWIRSARRVAKSPQSLKITQEIHTFSICDHLKIPKKQKTTKQQQQK